MRLSKIALLALSISLPATYAFAQDDTSEQEQRLKDAELRIEEAAREIAEISRSRMQAMPSFEFDQIGMGRRAVLGISMGGNSKGPVKGIAVLAVSPGSAAADSGLRAGDVITSVANESLAADSSERANVKMMNFMADVEPGDELDVKYLRAGKEQVTSVTPRTMHAQVEIFSAGNGFPAQALHAAPRINQQIWITRDSAWGGIELVKVSPALGRYFGTEKGLLVVNAPNSKDTKLEDGDVIQRIGNREPASVSHAMRILRSYQSGEELELEVMRDKKRRKFSVVVPDRTQEMSERRRELLESRIAEELEGQH